MVYMRKKWHVPYIHGVIAYLILYIIVTNTYRINGFQPAFIFVYIPISYTSSVCTVPRWVVVYIYSLPQSFPCMGHETHVYCTVVRYRVFIHTIQYYNGVSAY